MKPVNLLILILAAVLTASSCKESITKPEEPPAGRRDYVWKRDTLRASNEGWQRFHGIWGSSPTNVWIIGDAFTYVNRIWHYNGTKWQNYLLSEYAEPVSVWGVSSSELWMVTAHSDIWRYDGSKWYKHTTIVPAGYNRILFQDIYGYAKNIYAVGIAEKSDGDYTGIMVHYNGIKWEIIKTPLIKEYFFKVIFANGGDILISGENLNEPNEPARLYKFKDGEISLLGKNSNTRYALGLLNNKCYVSVNSKVYEYANGELIERISLPKNLYAGGIRGRSINDFFCANSGWYLGHYNGTNLENLYFIDAYIAAGLFFEKEVFFILNNQGASVLHGKLK